MTLLEIAMSAESQIKAAVDDLNQNGIVAFYPTDITVEQNGDSITIPVQ